MQVSRYCFLLFLKGDISKGGGLMSGVLFVLVLDIAFLDIHLTRHSSTSFTKIIDRKDKNSEG